MYPDYIADDDSLMVTVWYQVCAGATGQVNLTYSFTYGPSTSVITGGSIINAVNSNMNPVLFFEIYIHMIFFLFLNYQYVIKILNDFLNFYPFFSQLSQLKM